MQHDFGMADSDDPTESDPVKPVPTDDFVGFVALGGATSMLVKNVKHFRRVSCERDGREAKATGSDGDGNGRAQR